MTIDELRKLISAKCIKFNDVEYNVSHINDRMISGRYVIYTDIRTLVLYDFQIAELEVSEQKKVRPKVEPIKVRKPPANEAIAIRASKYELNRPVNPPKMEQVKYPLHFEKVVNRTPIIDNPIVKKERVLKAHEIEWIRRSVGLWNFTQMASLLNAPVDDIRRIAGFSTISATEKEKAGKFSEDEDELLKWFYPSGDIIVLCEELGRTKYEVNKRAKELKIKKDVK